MLIDISTKETKKLYKYYWTKAYSLLATAATAFEGPCIPPTAPQPSQKPSTGLPRPSVCNRILAQHAFVFVATVPSSPRTEPLPSSWLSASPLPASKYCWEFFSNHLHFFFRLPNAVDNFLVVADHQQLTKTNSGNSLSMTDRVLRGTLSKVVDPNSQFSNRPITAVDSSPWHRPRNKNCCSRIGYWECSSSFIFSRRTCLLPPRCVTGNATTAISSRIRWDGSTSNYKLW